MKSKKFIKNILFIFPSNLGDLLMCLPSVDYVKQSFPQAKVYAVAAPRLKEFIQHLSSIDAVLEYRKDWNWKEKLQFSISLRGKYQAVFDFKHSALPLFAAPIIRTALIRRVPGSIIHQIDQYRYLIEQALRPLLADSLQSTVHSRTLSGCRLSTVDNGRIPRSRVLLDPERKAYWDNFFKAKTIKKAIAISYASNTDKKNYPLKSFVRVCQILKKDHPILLIAKAGESAKSEEVLSSLPDRSGMLDLTGQTTLWDLWYIFQNYTALVIANDSGMMHLASYLDIKTIGIFGPTSAIEFAPWAGQSIAIVPQKRCRVCKWARCPDQTARCLYTIEPEKVVAAARELLRRQDLVDSQQSTVHGRNE